MGHQNLLNGVQARRIGFPRRSATAAKSFACRNAELVLSLPEKLEDLKDVHLPEFVFGHHPSCSSGLLEDLFCPSYVRDHFLVDLLFAIGVADLLLVVAILVDMPDIYAVGISEDLVARLVNAAGPIVTGATHGGHSAENITGLLKWALLNRCRFLAGVLLFHLEARELRVQVVEDVLDILRRPHGLVNRCVLLHLVQMQLPLLRTRHRFIIFRDTCQAGGHVEFLICLRNTKTINRGFLRDLRIQPFDAQDTFPVLLLEVIEMRHERVLVGSLEIKNIQSVTRLDPIS